MKKKLFVVLSIVMAFSFAGCGNTERHIGTEQENNYEDSANEDEVSGPNEKDDSIEKEQTPADEGDNNIVEESLSIKPLREVYFADGKFIGYVDYEYDGEDYKKITVYDNINKDNNCVYENMMYKKDSHGNKTHYYMFSADVYETQSDGESEYEFHCSFAEREANYKYNNNGQVTEEKSYVITNKGKKRKKELDYVVRNTYKNNRKIKSVAEYGSGKSKIIHEYDSKEREIKSSYISTFDRMKHKTVYKYGLKDKRNGLKYYSEKSYNGLMGDGQWALNQSKRHYVDDKGDPLRSFDLRINDTNTSDDENNGDYTDFNDVEVKKDGENTWYSNNRRYYLTDGEVELIYDGRELRDNQGRVLESATYESEGYENSGKWIEDRHTYFIYDQNGLIDESLYADREPERIEPPKYPQ